MSADPNKILAMQQLLSCVMQLADRAAELDQAASAACLYALAAAMKAGHEHHLTPFLAQFVKEERVRMDTENNVMLDG